MSREVLSERAQRALAELLALPRVRSYASYAGSRGKCFEASLSAATWFRAHLVPVRIVRFLNPRVVTPFSRETLLEANAWHETQEVELASGLVVTLNASELYHLRRLEQHAVEIEGALVVDLTWRGWEPESAFPRMTTLSEYARDFDVDDTICPHCGALAEEACRHPGHAIEAVVAHALQVGDPLFAALTGETR